MTDLDNCMRQGLIKKSVPSKEQALASLSKAKLLLDEAEANLEDERFNSATVVAYIAALNAARALLFKDGYRERSHFCTARYLESKYADQIPKGDIELFDHFRETRHDVQYEAEYFAEAESARQIIEFADRFIKLIEKIING